MHFVEYVGAYCAPRKEKSKCQNVFRKVEGQTKKHDLGIKPRSERCFRGLKRSNKSGRGGLFLSSSRERFRAARSAVGLQLEAVFPSVRRDRPVLDWSQPRPSR